MAENNKPTNIERLSDLIDLEVQDGEEVQIEEPMQMGDGDIVIDRQLRVQEDCAMDLKGRLSQLGAQAQGQPPPNFSYGKKSMVFLRNQYRNGPISAQELPGVQNH